MTGFEDGQCPVEALHLPSGHGQDETRREARPLDRNERVQELERAPGLVAIEMRDDVAQPIIGRRAAVRYRDAVHGGPRSDGFELAIAGYEASRLLLSGARARALSLKETFADLAINVHQRFDLLRVARCQQLRGLAIDEIRKTEKIAADRHRHRAIGLAEARLEDRPEAPILAQRGAEILDRTVLGLMELACSFEQRPSLRAGGIARFRNSWIGFR